MWRISHYAEESGFSITLMSRWRRKLLDAVMFACSKTYELSVFPCHCAPLHVIPLQYMSFSLYTSFPHYMSFPLYTSFPHFIANYFSDNDNIMMMIDGMSNEMNA